MPKLSIVTVCYQAVATLPEALDSVAVQTYPQREHWLIDGGSSDGTVALLKAREAQLAGWYSEPDRGVYHGMNKGLARVTGDYVAFLNADDAYADRDVLAAVAERLTATKADVLFGDLEMTSADRRRIVRRWRTGPYRHWKLYYGWLPPHPTFFARTALLRQLGGFRETYTIAADYDLMLRCLVHTQARPAYLPRVLVSMRAGGQSNVSLAAIVRSNREYYRAWRRAGMPPAPWLPLMKPAHKLLQLRWTRRRRGVPPNGDGVLK